MVSRYITHDEDCQNINFYCSLFTMGKKIYWIKYLSPFIGLLLSPVTILFLWTIWSGPVIESKTDVIEELSR